MKKVLSLLSIIALSVCVFTSCKKDSTAATSTNNTNGANTFTWTESSNSGTTLSADSAYATTTYKTIFVYKGNTSSRHFFEINLSSLAVGNYSFATSPNALAYKRPSTSSLIVATAGNVNITTNANNTISGTGVATISSTESINFSFTNLPVK